MLPSSPPTRTWKPSGSPAGSQYSINLDALDIDSRPGSSTGIPQPQVDRILSDDIDGPSDFTQNMEHWLRGSMRRQGTLRTRKQDSPMQYNRPVEQTIRQTSRQASVTLQEDRRDEPEAHNDDDGTMSNHTPAGTPPRISISQRTPGGDDQFSSEWEPYGITSTPFPDTHKDFLQPTVEDYHSELTPAAHSLRHSQVERKSFGFPGQASVFRPSGPAATYSESQQRPSPFLDQSSHGTGGPNVGRGTPSNVEAWQAKCRQLEQHITEIRKVLDEERRLRDEERAAHEADLAAADRQSQSSAETTYHARIEAETLRQECDTLKSQLQKQDELLSRAQLDKSTASQAILDQLRDAREELRAQTTTHAGVVQALQADLAGAHRTAQQHTAAAQEAAESRRVNELENLRATHDAEILRLQLQLQDAQDDEEMILELQGSLRAARAENEGLKAAGEQARGEIQELQTRLSADRLAHTKSASRQTVERARAVESAASFQKQAQELRQQLRQAQAQHQTALAAARAEQMAVSSAATQQELALLRRDLEARVVERNEALLDRDDAQDALRTAQAELETLRLEIAQVGNVNAALDARVADALRRRESRWRDRLLEADRERQVMAKALLHQWGREEAGRQDPQLYAYKYLQKSSSPPAEARRHPSSSPTEV